MSVALAQQATGEEIWFAPPDDITRPGQRTPLAVDFSALFTPDAPWRRAASAVRVFSIAAPYYSEHASDQQLKTIFAFLASRHIELNVTLEGVAAENCGRGVEGMVSVWHEPGDIARRMKSLGADVASFSFDGPLVSGHLYRGRQACGFTVGEVARRLAATVRDVRTSYPATKFFDYESVPAQPVNAWANTLADWLAAYRVETETRLDGLVMDPSWGKPWLPVARASAPILRNGGVKVGYFLTAAVVSQATDEMWMAQAHRNAALVEAAGISPDIAVVASWTPHPGRVLPETDPLALTSLINWYTGPQPRQ